MSTPFDVVIELRVDSRGWWTAEHKGSNREEVVALFGTAVLPTAFSSQVSSREVAAELRRLNPGAVVVVPAGVL